MPPGMCIRGRRRQPDGLPTPTAVAALSPNGVFAAPLFSEASQLALGFGVLSRHDLAEGAAYVVFRRGGLAFDRADRPSGL